MTPDLFEGNLKLIKSLLDAVRGISKGDAYIMEVCIFYIKALQLLSVMTWRYYPFHIGVYTYLISINGNVGKF